MKKTVLTFLAGAVSASLVCFAFCRPSEVSRVLGRVDFAKLCMSYEIQTKSGGDTVTIKEDQVGFYLRCPENNEPSVCRLTLRK